MKQKFINNILHSMESILSKKDLDLLEASLYYQLKGLDIIELEIDTNQNIENENIISQFISAKRIEGCSEKTLKYYKNTLVKLIETIKKNIKQINTEDLRIYLSDYQKMNCPSNTTIDNIRRILSSFFTWLEEENYIVKSPVRRIHKVKCEKNVKEIINDEQIVFLKDACTNSRDLALIEILSSTGIRVGELVGLNISDINFNERSCIVLGKYELNKIYNEDCYEAILKEDFKQFIEKNNKKVIIVTDPPFNINYHYGKYKDKIDEEEYYEKLDLLFTTYNIPFVVVHYPENSYKISFQTGLFPEKIVSWVYNSNTARQHRDIAFFRIKPNFNKVLQPYKNPNDKRIKERISKGKLGGKLYDWWYVNQVKNVSKNKNGNSHPCVMPIEIMKNIIGILPEDYIIFDPFMGSGTTAVAAKQLNRQFIGFEIDKEYHRIACERLEGITQEKEKGVGKNQLSIFDIM